jgi:hypothetical protein
MPLVVHVPEQSVIHVAKPLVHIANRFALVQFITPPPQ